MSQFVLCLFCLLVTHLKLAYQSQNHIDGKSGLKRAVLVKGAAQVSYGNFVADKFHRLQISVGSSTTVMNYRECAMSCVNTPPCASFNVASSPDVDGKFRCELLNEDKYSSLNQLISSQEYHHFSIKTTCSSYPCKNNGKCVPNYGDNRKHCDCAPGYEGRHCETDIDECSSNPCSNGGTCTDQVNGYVCSCQPEYTGAQCQTNINECSSNPCLNGGTCTDQVNGYVCSCQPGYGGAQCGTIMAGACFDNAVGVADPNTILNNQMTASSRYNGNYFGYNGRLNQANVWCAKRCCGSQDWLQIDLGKTFQICGVASQGNGRYKAYVANFKLSYSPDGSDWTTYKKADGSEMQFHRNGGNNQIDEHSLPVPLSTRYIRFIPTAQHRWNCLRVEVYGATP